MCRARGRRAQVDARISEEKQRIAEYLHVSTASKLKEIWEEHLISAHAKRLIEMEGSGFVAMIRDSKTVDMRRMYSLFKPLQARARTTICILVCGHMHTRMRARACRHTFAYAVLCISE